MLSESRCIICLVQLGKWWSQTCQVLIPGPQNVMFGRGNFVNSSKLMMRILTLKIWVGSNEHHKCPYDTNKEQDSTHSKGKGVMKTERSAQETTEMQA